jgi:hypothetical protein
MRKEAPRNVQIAVWLVIGLAASAAIWWFYSHGWPTGHRPLGLLRLQGALFVLPPICVIGAIMAYFRGRNDKA